VPSLILARWRTRSAAVLVCLVCLALTAACGGSQSAPDPDLVAGTVERYVDALNQRDVSTVASIAVSGAGVSKQAQEDRVAHEVDTYGGKGIDPASIVVTMDASPALASVRFTVVGSPEVRAMEWVDGAWRITLGTG
jgi:hypothetical protein